MKLSIVLSTHAAQFQAVAFKGDFESNVAKIAGWGYDGVEIAIRDPRLVDADELLGVVSEYGLAIPAIGRSRLSFPNIRSSQCGLLSLVLVCKPGWARFRT